MVANGRAIERQRGELEKRGTKDKRGEDDG